MAQFSTIKRRVKVPRTNGYLRRKIRRQVSLCGERDNGLGVTDITAFNLHFTSSATLRELKSRIA